MTQILKTELQPMDEKKHNPPARSPEDFHLRIAAAHRSDAFNSVAFSPDGYCWRIPNLAISTASDRSIVFFRQRIVKKKLSLLGLRESAHLIKRSFA